MSSDPNVKRLHISFPHFQCFCIAFLLLVCFDQEVSGTHCAAGSEALPGEECTPCKQGLYKNGTGDGGCIPCPPNFHASPGLGAVGCVSCTGLNDCQCAEGHGLYGNITDYECRKCEKGSYSMQYGLLQCVLCAPGFFQNQEGATRCNRCSRGTSLQGAESCFDSCKAGKYLTRSGCVSCPTGTISPPGSTDLSMCTCAVGFTTSGRTGPSCDVCSSGYHAEIGINSATNLSLPLECWKCPEGKFSVVGSLICYGECEVNYYLSRVGCMPCRNPSRRRLLETGWPHESEGFEVPDNTTYLKNSEPLTEDDYPTSGTCNCEQGYTGGETGVICVPCAKGTYKNKLGGGGCTACPDGFNYSPVGSTVSADACTCDVGSFRGAGTCTDCLAGTFKMNTGAQACTICDVGKYSAEAKATECTTCGGNNGIVMTYTPCIACDEINHSVEPGMLHLEEAVSGCVGGCVIGSDAATSRTGCRGCVQDEILDIVTSTCVCNPDYYRPVQKDTNSNTCISCPENTFKVASGDEICTPCRANSIRVHPENEADFIQLNPENQTFCVCKPGSFEDIEGRCTLCALGTFKKDIGGHACTACDYEHSTDLMGSTYQSDCKCATGSYSTNVGTCAKCPKTTYSPFVGDGDISQCRMCPYKMFQPLSGQKVCLPMFVSLLDVFEADSRVVGLFVDGSTSCAYVSRDSTKETDKICWGSKTERNPTTTRALVAKLADVCGDGIPHPILEGCDDGNVNNGDGCSETCEIEHDFFCESLVITPNITDILRPSVCCRRSGNPPSHTPSCMRCTDRVPPYPGVSYRARDCGLQDIDECAEGTDGCVLKEGGVACVNQDATQDRITRFRCECPIGKFMSDMGCIPERFAVKFAFHVDPETLSVRQANKIELGVRAEAHRATDGAENLLDVHIDSDTVGLIQCTMFVGSWNGMQTLTAKFNVTHLHTHFAA
jgi:cysteine-rich repeat protein